MVCKLCGSKKPLQLSHIIPKSYFRALKSGNGQLVSVTCDSDSVPKKSNTDPKEKLLCRECEQFLGEKYEQYGTRLFKSSRGIKDTKNYIELNGFKYTEYYLFLISILWRASLSSLKAFSNVALEQKLEDLLASCIRAKSLKLNTSLKLDHFIRISVLRVVDTKCGLDDNIISKVLMHFGVEAGGAPQDGLVYYFMIDGFFIGYYLAVGSDIHATRTLRIRGQLINSCEIKIPKIEVSELKQVYETFRVISIKAQNE